MNSHHRPKPLVLCILDGWGDRAAAGDNAIEAARAPNWHRLIARWPHAQLQASEHDVGLPDGQMGNSEVGHTNLGAGRLVLQDLPRIDEAIAAGTLATMPALRAFIGKLKESGGTAHVLGLVSPGGVHSHQHQIAALARIAAEAGVPVAVHAFLDGRDTPPKSAARLSGEICARCRRPGPGVDRDDRRPLLCDGPRQALGPRRESLSGLIAEGDGEHADGPPQAIEAAYRRGETDEFVRPTAIAGYRGMADGDGLLIANFRADRVREIAAALLDPDFSGFTRAKPTAFAAALGLVEYSTGLNRFLDVLFPPADLEDTFGEVVSKAGLSSCASPRPRNTRMSRFSSMAGARRSFPARSASWCRRPRSRPTICSLRCRHPRSPTRWSRRSAPAPST